MGVSAIGWTNQVTRGSLLASSSAVNMTPGNLQSDQCSTATGWQTVDGSTTTTTGAILTCTFLSPVSPCHLVILSNTNLTPAAIVSVKLYSNPATLLTSKVVFGPTSGSGQVVAWFSATQTADWVEIDFDDPTNPDNHINVGGLFIGGVWMPATGVAWDSKFGRNVRTQEVQSRGGQEWPVFQSQQRRRTFSFQNLRDTDMANIQDLNRVAALGGNVAFVPNVNSPTISLDAIFGRFQATDDVSYPFHNASRLSFPAAITERL